MCFPSSSSLFSPFTSLVPFLSLSLAQRGDPPPLFLSPSSSSSSSRFLSLLFLLQGEEGKKETESPLSSFSFLPSSFLRSFSFGAVRKGRGKAGREEAYALGSLAAIGQAEKGGWSDPPCKDTRTDARPGSRNHQIPDQHGKPIKQVGPSWANPPFSAVASVRPDASICPRGALPVFPVPRSLAPFWVGDGVPKRDSGNCGECMRGLGRLH